MTTELKVYSTEELDMRVGSRLSESLYPPQALIVADHHFVMATQVNAGSSTNYLHFTYNQTTLRLVRHTRCLFINKMSLSFILVVL